MNTLNNSENMNEIELSINDFDAGETITDYDFDNTVMVSDNTVSLEQPMTDAYSKISE